MRTLGLAASAAVLLSAGTAFAGPVTLNLFNATDGLLGASVTFGTTPSLTTRAGTYSGATTSLPNGEQLYSENDGPDKQGLGVCKSTGSFNGACLNGSNTQEVNQGNELVQLDLVSLAGYGSFFINIDSATGGEKASVYESNSASSLGTFVGFVASADNDFSLGDLVGFRYLNVIASSGDVLVHSVTATQKESDPVAEPTMIALLGSGLLAFGLVRRRRA